MLKVESYFEAFIIILLVGAFLYLVSTFTIALLLASTFVFLFYKPYLFICSIFRNKELSAFFMLIFVSFLILGPLYWIATSLITQTSNIINTTYTVIEGVDLTYCDLDLCRTIESKVSFINLDFNSVINGFAGFISTSTSIQAFTFVSKFVIDIFIFVLAFFFLLIDGKEFVMYVKRLIPMKNSYKESLFIKFRDVTQAVFVDTLLVAMMQGALVSIGFIIVGISNPVFWGVIATFFALIPILGAPVVWIPAVFYLFFTEQYWFFIYDKALFLLIYSATIVGLSDNIVRPILLKSTIQVHPFLILLSIMGGLELFSFFGIFIGPIIISLLVSVIQLYKLDFK